MLDVAVIGAGPVGLSTAAALFKSTESAFNVQVFEKMDSLRQCGAGFALQANGFRALHAIDANLYEMVLGVTVPTEAANRYMPDGTVTRTVMGTLEHHGFPSGRLISWSNLRQTLVDWLPPDTVQLGKQFASLQQHHDHVTVHFADGSSVAARVVVGADGVFSRVRRQSLADGLPDYTGMTFLRAVLPWQDGFPASEIHQFFNGSVFGSIYPISKSQCVWSLVVQDSKPDPAGKNNTTSEHSNDLSAWQHTGVGDALVPGQGPRKHALHNSAHERAKQFWAGGPSVIEAAIAATDPETVLEHQQHVRHPSSLNGGHWGVGRVTLAGDAAHATRSVSGQGVNQGLEDAAALGQHIRAGGLCPASLRTFEASRIPRIQEIMAAEMAAGLKVFPDKPAQLPQDLAKYRFAKQNWAEASKASTAEYADWLLSPIDKNQLQTRLACLPIASMTS